MHDYAGCCNALKPFACLHVQPAKVCCSHPGSYKLVHGFALSMRAPTQSLVFMCHSMLLAWDRTVTTAFSSKCTDPRAMSVSLCRQPNTATSLAKLSTALMRDGTGLDLKCIALLQCLSPYAGGQTMLPVWHSMAAFPYVMKWVCQLSV